MINKNDLAGRDDWLAKELEREKRISAWDMDEGRLLKEEHAKDCDVRNVAEEHHARHVAYDEMRKGGIRKMSRNDMLWFILLIVLFIILSSINSFLFRNSYFLPALICFLGINPGIFIWLILFRRFPPASYCRIVFFLALLVEAYGLFTRYFYYLF